MPHLVMRHQGACQGVDRGAAMSFASLLLVQSNTSHPPFCTIQDVTEGVRGDVFHGATYAEYHRYRTKFSHNTFFLDDCTSSSVPMCSDNLCVVVSSSGAIFTPDGLSDSRVDLYGDKDLAVKHQGGEVLSRGVSAPGIGSVGFRSGSIWPPSTHLGPVSYPWQCLRSG